ncbi:ectoine/hydroxyectoine ABC transporter substrate-binding protein EhuB [Bradyrhizobium sp. 38]|uniref:ectoine/hydroxyectoine ABC transporter substrate-binding protein EhuB n=1 Tax=unclassified Bradyrhizobium TaxID=2631580 RepID=UPI001FF91211|nr:MULTISPECIES: ectoine/hydroxyectoine ABC transporter substrate-binding protein EhuB [unclassified Bradyrhizobium]MCK1336677.1 ectoine/hydroxyectoine ABC transporter substrate-binding protein EhuB [Bradyrhizobium sp. 38]MCK1777027.1 ectoine/hydroxyectoine ABC transporter substrate-binding protein EhuB [Bradyrhizobium sp. 132]
MKLKIFAAVAAVLFNLIAPVASAGPLTSRLESGAAIRIGFANSPPYAFVGPGGEPAGFMNAYVINLLKKMGYTKLEVVTSDFSGLIPALQAGRIDIVTSGLYIKKDRCSTIAFTDPMLKTADALLVPKGNPKGLQNYEDVAKKNATMTAVVGYATIDSAKKFGVPADRIMQLPDGPSVLAAVRSGRADAAANSDLSLQAQAKGADGSVEVTDSSKMPESTFNWVAFGLRKTDFDFISKFNAAQKEFLGSPEMLSVVAPFGYSEKQLPGSTSLEWICENR